eukprot:COSAG04_NODE_12308_length_659_cov_0.587500_2_plen_87_part_00
MNSRPLGCAGHTWSGLTVVHGESSQSKHVTIGNPAPIVDMATGRVHMLFSRNNKEAGVLSSDDNVRPPVLRFLLDSISRNSRADRA